MVSEELRKKVENFVMELLKEEETRRSPEMVQALAELLKVIANY